MGTGSGGPYAGKDFPWEYVTGYYLRVIHFTGFAMVLGDVVKSGVFGAYGVASVELPNPDVEPDKRVVELPIENKSDYKSIYRAYLDSGVKDGTNEIVVLWENRKGFLGSRRPSLHVATYPVGTWLSFFNAVAAYRPHDFQWPEPLFLFQPSNTQAFPLAKNLFSA